MLVVLGLMAAAHSAAACPKLTAVPTSLTYPSPYDQTDPTRSRVLPAKQSQMKAALWPVDHLLGQLSRQADQLDDPAAMECLRRHLTHWAQAEALRDLKNDQVKMTIGARLAAFAILTRRLRHAGVHKDQLAPVTDWLLAQTQAQVAFWDTEAPPSSRMCNLRAWANLAVWTTADLTDRPELQDWAVTSHKDILCSARGDGSLPSEMRRGQFSLHYQLHALAPLVTLQAMISTQSALPCADALLRAVEFALSDIANGTKTAALAGAPQSYFNGTEELEAHELAWIEAFLTLNPSPQAQAIAKPLRPLRHSKLGGNQTNLWGH